MHDVFDGSVVRSWLNSPLSHTLEMDIYAATNIAKGFVNIGQLGPERGIPSYILGSAAGFALLSVAKVLAHAMPCCMWCQGCSSALICCRREAWRALKQVQT